MRPPFGPVGRSRHTPGAGRLRGMGVLRMYGRDGWPGRVGSMISKPGGWVLVVAMVVMLGWGWDSSAHPLPGLPPYVPRVAGRVGNRK